MGPKERLIETVAELFENGENPQNMSVREIAAKADVTFGLINYHFGSKEALLSEAVSMVMRNKTEALFEEHNQDKDETEVIKQILFKNAVIGLEYPAIASFMTKIEIKENSRMGGILSLLPVLRQKFSSSKTEEELLIMASQIILPLQFFYLNSDMLQNHLGWDMQSEKGYRKFIDTILKNLV